MTMMTWLYFCIIFVADPLCFEEEVKNESWKKSKDEEKEGIEKYQTWQLLNLPKGNDAIGVKWIYKIKFNVDGNCLKHK